MRNFIKPSFLLGIIGGITTSLSLPYLLGIISPEMLAKNPLPFSPLVLSIIMGLQGTVMMTILSFVGLFLGSKIKLGAPVLMSIINKTETPKLSGKWVIGGTISIIIITLITNFLDKLIFLPKIPALANVDTSVAFWKRLLAIFYGGAAEEIMMRLFLMTLIIWVSSLFIKNKEQIPSWIYWMGIFIAGIIFGLGHLPATLQVVGYLNSLIVFRGILFNGLFAVLLGFIYWKKGLEHAMLTHLIADVFLHLL